MPFVSDDIEIIRSRDRILHQIKMT
jgi:hypothetical protein